MRIWLGTGITPDMVHVFYKKPEEKHWATDGKFWIIRHTGVPAAEASRRVWKKMLRGTGITLPRHETKTLVEVELIARRPK